MKLKEYLELIEPGAEVTCWDRDIDSEFYFYTKTPGEKTLYGDDFPNVNKCDELLREHLDVVAIRDNGIEVNLYELLENPAIIKFAKEHMFEKHQYEDDSDVTMMLFDDNVKNFSNGYEGFSKLMVQCLNEAFDEKTRLICVYKDTIAPHGEVDNLVNIEVPKAWLYNVLRAEGVTDIDTWFDEYTADSTDSIARKAVVDGVILGCDDEYVTTVLKIRSEHPELIESADKVKHWIEKFGGNIPEGLGFEFKGMWTNNPFYDESIRFEVEPFAYYGIENMQKYIQQATNIMSRECDKHIDLDDVIRSCEKLSKRTVEQKSENEKNPEIEM